ncbi:MAG: hypothetical protein WC091_25945 [Sulfuricellaceae bacterium]
MNAGIYVLAFVTPWRIYRPTFFIDRLTLFEKLFTVEQTVAAYPLLECWSNIGRQEEFDRAQQVCLCEAPV